MIENYVDLILGFLLLLASVGVIVVKKPVHASLCFLATLLLLAGIYLQLSAQFIGVLQILVYAGAILVIFMFVIVLFQDAHEKISQFAPKSPRAFLWIAAAALVLAFLFLAIHLTGITGPKSGLPLEYGTVRSLGDTLYLDFFFPFEVVVLLFLIAVVGALYIARKET